MISAYGNIKGWYLRVDEQEAAAEQDLALLVLLEDFGTVGDDVGDDGVVVFIGKARELHAVVDDEHQELLFFGRVGDLGLVEQQSFSGRFL